MEKVLPPFSLASVVGKIFIALPLYIYFVSEFLLLSWKDLKLASLCLFMAIMIKFRYSALLFGIVFVYMFLKGNLHL